MILILSETYDNITDEVCRWLNFYNAKYIRINECFVNYSFSLALSNEKITPILYIRDKEIPFSSIFVSWFRRGYFNFINNLESQENNIFKYVSNVKYRDFKCFSEYLYYYLKHNTKCFGYPQKYNINKLEVLDNAVKEGFRIPNSIIVQNYKELENLYIANDGKVITKAITDWSSSSYLDAYSYSNTTKEIDLDDIPKTFFYSLFQQQIPKSFEVRTFVWDNKIYSAAIYVTPDNVQARIDFRNSYDTIKIVPYKLPENINNRLLSLMNNFGLESGSADFIVDDDMNYWFLEINPVGQFDFVDKYCNYGLAHIIAKKLIEYADK